MMPKNNAMVTITESQISRFICFRVTVISLMLFVMGVTLARLIPWNFTPVFDDFNWLFYARQNLSASSRCLIGWIMNLSVSSMRLIGWNIRCWSAVCTGIGQVILAIILVFCSK
jgi:hypothetical protein